MGKTIRKNRALQLNSVASISLVLFLFGMLGMLIINAHLLANYVKENIALNVMIKDDAKEIEVKRLKKYFSTVEYVKSVKYITKEDAAAELKDELGEDFEEFLGYNPLLSSIEVKLYSKYANVKSIQKIEKEFSKFELVKEVYYKKSLIHLVNENVRKISFVLLFFIGVMFFIFVTLINNTVRLGIFSRRFIIRTMQLVGATKQFVRKPFMQVASVNGFLGGVIAGLLLYAVLHGIELEIGEFISIYDNNLLIFLFVFIVIFGVAIMRITTYLAVNKYLRIEKDKLYKW